MTLRELIDKLPDVMFPLKYIVYSVIILLFLGSPILWFVADYLGHWTTTRVDLINIYVTSILTIALILVYADIAKREKIQSIEAERLADLGEEQTKLQGEQTDLQEKMMELQEEQQRFREANHKSVIQISDWNVGSTGDGEEHVNLELKNKGNGLAQNLRIKPDISVYQQLSGSEVYLGVRELYGGSGGPEGVESHSSPVRPKQSRLSGESSVVLQAGDEGVFSANVQFHRVKLDRRDGKLKTVDVFPFSEVLSRVKNAEKIYVNLELEYENILGESDSIAIYSEIVEPDGAETLAELSNRGDLTMT